MCSWYCSVPRFPFQKTSWFQCRSLDILISSNHIRILSKGVSYFFPSVSLNTFPNLISLLWFISRHVFPNPLFLILVHLQFSILNILGFQIRCLIGQVQVYVSQSCRSCSCPKRAMHCNSFDVQQKCPKSFSQNGSYCYMFAFKHVVICCSTIYFLRKIWFI